jgi:hypothetical protein
MLEPAQTGTLHASGKQLLLSSTSLLRLNVSSFQKYNSLIGINGFQPS